MTMRKKIVTITGILIVVVLLAIVGWLIKRNADAHANKIFFNRVDADYTTLDKSLDSLSTARVEFQTTSCYYWKKSEFSFSDNGPLGCFKNRAYYFAAADLQSALSLSRQLSLAVTTAFSNVQDQHFAMQVPSMTGKDSFVIDDTVPSYASIPGACSVHIDYPSPKTQAYQLPSGPKDKPLELSISCGGNATEAYYPLIAQ
jgi:hypothetical protein